MALTDTPRRQRASDGATAKLLRLLLWLPTHKAEIATAASAVPCTINAIHQAAHRLRGLGLPLATIPPPPLNQWTGPATHYQLPTDWVDFAQSLLEVILCPTCSSTATPDPPKSSGSATP